MGSTLPPSWLARLPPARTHRMQSWWLWPGSPERPCGCGVGSLQEPAPKCRGFPSMQALKSQGRLTGVVRVRSVDTSHSHCTLVPNNPTPRWLRRGHSASLTPAKFLAVPSWSAHIIGSSQTPVLSVSWPIRLYYKGCFGKDRGHVQFCSVLLPLTCNSH